MSIARPVLRGFQDRKFKKSIIGASIFAAIVGAAYKFGVAMPRSKRYEDYYRTYDPEADAERMRKLGLFQGAKKDDY